MYLKQISPNMTKCDSQTYLLFRLRFNKKEKYSILYFEEKKKKEEEQKQEWLLAV